MLSFNVPHIEIVANGKRSLMIASSNVAVWRWNKRSTVKIYRFIILMCVSWGLCISAHQLFSKYDLFLMWPHLFHFVLLRFEFLRRFYLIFHSRRQSSKPIQNNQPMTVYHTKRALKHFVCHTFKPKQIDKSASEN